MRFNHLCFLLLILCTTNTLAQDTIVRKNGERISCKIIEEDSLKVEFELYNKGYYRTTYLEKAEIQKVVYKKKETPWFQTSDVASIGFGIGQDLGGLGGNLIIYPQRNFGLFGGIGYPGTDIGFNVGIKARVISKSTKDKAIPFAIAMYGYNGAIVVVNAPDFNSVFYGSTAGLGFDYMRKSTALGYWSFAVFLPIRQNEFYEYITELESKGVKLETPPIPISISISYKMLINFWEQKKGT